MKKIKSIVFVVALSLTQLLWAQQSPIPMLEGVANQVLTTLKQNKTNLKNNPQVIYQAVRRYLLPHVDVSGMSRSVLGRQAWNKASADEKRQFTNAFTQLVIRTYASPLAEYTDETIKFLPIRGSLASRFTRVNSIIVRSNGEDIPLSYNLVFKNGGWKIYNLSVVGVGLVESFQTQCAEVLQNSSMQSLIKQMNQRHFGKKAA